MHEHEQEPSVPPAFAEARRRRADLHHALVDVERAISGPALGREAAWAAEVSVRLKELLHTIDEHVEAAERPLGLYDEITARAPRLSGQIERLKAEHPLLRETTRALIAKLEATPIGEAWSLGEARDEVQRLLGRIVRHRQLGADLVWEAYNLDIGGIE